MRSILNFFSVLFFFFFCISNSFSQCAVCTLTNPSSLPNPIPSGTIVCITVNKTYGGGANLTGGSIHVCSGARLRINGSVDISATSSITTTGCSSVEVNGNIQNNNPAGLVVLDGCNCAYAINVSGPIFGFGVVCSPLPVELVSFNATVDRNSVSLDWSTATEINNEYFIVERSVDLISWTQVAKVAGAGNSNQLLKYNASDIVNSGVYYYRLVQVDFNGDLEKFDPIAVTVSHSTIDLNIYPNPATDSVVLKVGGTSETIIEILNLSGQIIYKSFIGLSDSREMRVDLTGFDPGVYLVRAYGENISQSSRLIIGKN